MEHDLVCAFFVSEIEFNGIILAIITSRYNFDLKGEEKTLSDIHFLIVFLLSYLHFVIIKTLRSVLKTFDSIKTDLQLA